MNKTKFDQFFMGMVIFSDIILLPLLVILAYYLRFEYQILPLTAKVPDIKQYIETLWFVEFIFIGSFFVCEVYRLNRKFSEPNEFYTVFAGTTFAIIILMAMSFIYRKKEYSRVTVALFYFLCISIIPTIHIFIYLLKKWLKQKLNVGISNFLIINPFCGKYQKEIQKLSRNNNILKIDNKIDFKVIHSIVPDEIIILAPHAIPKHQIIDLINYCEPKDIVVKIVPDLSEIYSNKVSVKEIENIYLLEVVKPKINWLSSRIAKRSLDLLCSSIGLVILSPFFILIAVIIKLTSKGPVFFVQKRVGKNEKSFNMYKFRTMIAKAEKQATWTTKNDPRVTTIGKFLRKTSLDELPQLINVLIGNMSLVGPRPEQPRYVQKFKKEIPRYEERHKVKPGITGWAQVNELRGDTDIYARLQHDLFYIHNWSIFFDIEIIIKTIAEVLFHKSAY